ncbi:MAG: YbhB/YbcL family Raf kinase inhibitor-like protein [Candidatus Zixiibacteriota bacterium]
MIRIFCLLTTVGVCFSACREKHETETLTRESTTEAKIKEEVPKGEETMALTITSTAFQEGGIIPKQYTCDGADISPPLAWSGVPEGTKSLALISDDPDAPVGTWVHWVLFNIPPDTNKLPENVPTDQTLSDGATNGVNDFGKLGYGGPCPPSGTHRYYFKIYALDTMLDLSGRVTKKDLLKAMEGHILAEAQLMGKYKRQ